MPTLPMGTAARATPIRKALLRTEGLFWLTRPQSAFSKVPLALAAWVLGRGDQATSPLQAVFLVVFLVSMQALLFVINDIVDTEADRKSAPYMPIPSGVASMTGAVTVALGLGGAFLLAVGVLGSRTADVLIVLATMPAALATMKLYGRTKSAWFSPFLASTASASAPLWTWLLAGHRNVAPFALLFAITSLHGVHANLRAQLRDIEGDPKAGNITLAVRLGAKKTFWVAVIVRLVELAAIVALGLWLGAHLGMLWLVPTLAVLVWGLATAPRIYAENRDRVGQTDALSLWVYISFLTEISVLALFLPVFSLPIATVMFLWFNLVRKGYYGRLVGGRLKKLAALSEPDPGAVAAATPESAGS